MTGRLALIEGKSKIDIYGRQNTSTMFYLDTVSFKSPFWGRLASVRDMLKISSGQIWH